MNKTIVREETVIIPTYPASAPEKNPLFLENRAYQGSSGKVYPLPVTEKISDKKIDAEYKAVFLENEYLLVMILPELGGRIQRALDKTNNYDFIYYNHVIKPALVGLAGPWISGGIEFNWPQHHRPSTFMPADYCIRENADGSASVFVSEIDRMYGTKGMARITLCPGKAYIEIKGQLYNRTDLPQTFLWWANPAVPVNEKTYSVFPPDVREVMDHGRRAVSTFPIATGEYYKYDYSEGVDISRYSNIKVPTSYMAARSDYDFIGNFDEGRDAGLMHVADHHISPGKKQWTWGCGDFGKTWDKNLTDEDGPYIELMTGVFADNQPDFTWLKPCEEKTFTQYFMPYKHVGRVKNASKDAAISMEIEDGGLRLKAYTSSAFENARIRLCRHGACIFSDTCSLSPLDTYDRLLSFEDLKKNRPGGCIRSCAFDAGVSTSENVKNCEKPAIECHKADQPGGIPDFSGTAAFAAGDTFNAAGTAAFSDGKNLDNNFLAGYTFELSDKSGRILVSYTEQPKRPKPPVSAADPMPEPADLKSTEECYLAARHLEQYRHATYCPEDYYLEGLRRDPTDIRLNNGYGLLLYRRGNFAECIPYFERAIKKQTGKNANPYNGEVYFNLGLALTKAADYPEPKEKIMQSKHAKHHIHRKKILLGKAFDAFYKSTWSAETQSSGFYQLSCLSCRAGRYEEALDFAEKSLIGNWHNMKARVVKAAVLRKLGRPDVGFIQESLKIDPLDMGMIYEDCLLKTTEPASSFEAVTPSAEIKAGLDSVSGEMNNWLKAMRGQAHNYLELSLDYIKAGFYEDALQILKSCPDESPMPHYYQGYVLDLTGETIKKPGFTDKAREEYALGEAADYSCCFPNRLEEIIILEQASLALKTAPRAHYYLGCLYYDKKQYRKAFENWFWSIRQDENFAPAYRNMAICLYNHPGCCPPPAKGRPPGRHEFPAEPNYRNLNGHFPPDWPERAHTGGHLPPGRHDFGASLPPDSAGDPYSGGHLPPCGHDFGVSLPPDSAGGPYSGGHLPPCGHDFGVSLPPDSNEGPYSGSHLPHPRCDTGCTVPRPALNAALYCMEKAFSLDGGNSRMLLEYDQLRTRAGFSNADRLSLLEKHMDLVGDRDTLCLEYITLLNNERRYDDALRFLSSRRFHPWEGGEGKVSGQYRYALTQKAIKLLEDGDINKAIELLNSSKVYPENLGEGKLPNVQDTIADYYLGLAYEKLGNTLKANQHFLAASVGLDKPESVLYYNDQPSDTIYYQGLANEKLGNQKAASKCFHQLLTFGQQHLFDNVKYDYFAVSLPEIEIFPESIRSRNTNYCLYLSALGRLGLGDKEKARRELLEILNHTPGYQGALRHI